MPGSVVRPWVGICYALRTGALFLIISHAAGVSFAADPPTLTPSEDPLVLRHARQFSDLHQVLLLRNTSGTPLEIDRVWSCCGCVATLLSDSRVGPGGTADVLITFNPWSASGKIRKYLLVYVKGGERRPMRVHLEADVPQDFLVVPPIAHVGSIEHGKGRSQTVTITRFGRNAFAPAALSYNHDLMTVTASPSSVTGRGTSVSFRVDMKTDAPLGAFMSTVTGTCGEKDSSAFGFLVSGRVTGDLRVAPERVVLAGLTPGDPATKEVQLTSRSGAGFRVLDVASDSAVVTASWQPSAADRQRITLTFDTAKAEGNVKAVLSVKTSHPREKTLDIPVLVLLRDTPTPGSPLPFSRPSEQVDTPVGRSGSATVEAYRKLFAAPPASGLRTVAYPAGRPAKEFPFREGRLHGTVKTYLEDGTLWYSQQYRNGRETEFTRHNAASAGEGE